VRICIVAYVVPAHAIGGMQDHTRDLACGLVRAGHEVEVITSSHPEGGRKEEVVDGVQYIFVDAPRQKYHPAWRRESYSEFVRREAEGPFDVLHSESASTVELFRRGVHRRLPVVVMLHGTFLGLAKAQLKGALRTRRPVPLLRAIRGVQWLATNEAFRHGNWYRYRACEVIVPSRQQVKDTRRSCLLKESRVHVVPNGIDAELFRPRPVADARARLGLGSGPIFVAVGRLSPDKGFHHAVQALALLDGEASDAKLIIVGEGPERQRLEWLSRQLEIDERVIFAGTQTHDGVAFHLAAADVFLFPTERDEAAPLVLPQAMACAKPVVASRTGGITEVIGESGEYGILVPPGDAAVLANEMSTLLSDPSLRQRLGEAARRRVLAEYSIERMVERTLDVYRIAIARLDQEAAGSRSNASSASIPGPTRRAT
jgi:glycosyltransferase involved in cell wall biosynthesis